jgi:2-dehydro-3-deoxygluconokinase
MVLVHPTGPVALESAVAFRLDVGGAESNVASHLVRRGVPAAWAGAVGDDALGRRLIATLQARGVDTGLAVVDSEAPTGVYFKDPGAGVLYYRRDSAASRLGAAFAGGLPLDTVPWVHLSGITAAISARGRSLLEAIFGARSAAGLPISFDVNHRPALWSGGAAEALLSFARRADLVFVGRDEAAELWNGSSDEELRALLLAGRAPGVQLVIKDGGVGATALTSGFDDAWFVPAPALEVVEMVGAGDAFAAGYLAAMIAGADPQASLAAGHEAAAGALGTMTDYAESA